MSPFTPSPSCFVDLRTSVKEGEGGERERLERNANIALRIENTVSK